MKWDTLAVVTFPSGIWKVADCTSPCERGGLSEKSARRCRAAHSYEQREDAVQADYCQFVRLEVRASARRRTVALPPLSHRDGV